MKKISQKTEKWIKKLITRKVLLILEQIKVQKSIQKMKIC